MKGMSEREYAAHSGLSRGGVQKARKNGRLVVHDDGSINAAASDVRRRVATRYDRCPKVFLSAIALAALVIYWL